MTTTPKPRGPYKMGRQRKKEIVDAALTVFASRGYRASTIKDIADAVGITPAAVLRYFSKEELLTEVLQHWEKHQKWVGESGPGLAYFRAFPDLMRYHVAHRGYLELYLTFAVDASDTEHPAHEYMTGRFTHGLSVLRTQLREAIRLEEILPMDDATIHFEAACFYAILDGVEVQWLLNDKIDLVGIVTEYIEQAISRWKTGARLITALATPTRDGLPLRQESNVNETDPSDG